VFDALGGARLARYGEAFCDAQSCDECHPNDAGYEALAAAVHRALMSGSNRPLFSRAPAAVRPG
jgi:hypothetical protein